MIGEMQSRGLPVPELPAESLSAKRVKWPLDDSGYFVGFPNIHYEPSEQQAGFIASTARNVLFYGSRGSGKSGAGAQKSLKKIMQGESGAVLNPDFENFKLSTWPEFKKWIPWDMVIPSQRVRGSAAWEPTKPFVLVFINGARVYCKGLKDAESARGPNINWLWYDESGRDESGLAWQLANASVRVGNNPQAWCTQTAKPPSHWSYKFFILKQIPTDAMEEFMMMGLTIDDIVASFHGNMEENKSHLDPMFYANMLATYHSGALREREIFGRFVADGGQIGDSSKLRIIDELNPSWKLGKECRYWDMAATEKKLGKGGNDPDEAVGTKVQTTESNDPDYIIKDQIGGWFAWEQLKELIAVTALADGPSCTVVIEQEPASGGKNQVAELQLYFKNHPTYPMLKYYRIEGQRPTDRVAEAYTWFGFANSGHVYMIRNDFWNDKLKEQIDGFTQMEHDDRVTSCSGAMRWLMPLFKRWKKVDFIQLGPG